VETGALSQDLPKTHKLLIDRGYRVPEDHLAELPGTVASDSQRRGHSVRTPGAPIVAAGKCSLELPNVAITYSTTSQSTWSEGASLSDYIGINLSSQDGWSGSSELTDDLKVKAAICGVRNTPNSNNPSGGYLQVH
jgi:hypothetical protein